jgi:hypothetical protein
MARKQTSARVSKIAGKYMGATDAGLRLMRLPRRDP